MCFNTPGFVYAMLGAWRIGAVVVPINHKMQTPEVDYILRHAKVSVCVFDGELAPVIERLETPAQLLSAPTPPWRVSTSSTTPSRTWTASTASRSTRTIPLKSSTPPAPPARPRAACTATATSSVWRPRRPSVVSTTRDERLLMAVPIWHASPLNNWFMSTLYMGGTVVLVREYHPVHFLETVQEQRITLCFGPPVIYTTAAATLVPNFTDYDLVQRPGLALRRRPDRRRCRAPTRWSRTGPPLPPGVRDDRDRSRGHCPLPRGTAREGRLDRPVALAGVDMRLAGHDGTDVEPEQIGEIWLRTDTVMQGYLDDPAPRSRASADGGWYRTGDLARKDDDGYLFIVDRAKDMIITGGENVYSKEVEDAISGHPGRRGRRGGRAAAPRVG